MKEMLYAVGETFNLLQGYKDESGVIHTEFEIREMNGTDEEAISKPEIKANGGKIVRTILERCLLRVGTLDKSELKANAWRDVIQNLSVGDQDYILLKIRQISMGDEIESKYTCPNADCKEEIITIVEVDELELKPFNGDRVIEFELPRGFRNKEGKVFKKGTMRHPNGLDREVLDTIIRKNQGVANTLMLSRVIIDVDGMKVHDDLIRNLSIKDRNYLLDVIKENTFGINLEVDVDCPSCYTSFKASLNAVNFL